MSEALATAYVDIGVNFSMFATQLAKARGMFASACSGMASGTNALKKELIGLAGLFRTLVIPASAVAAFGGFTVKIASDAEEINSKFSAVFKNLTGEAQLFAEQFAKGVGRSVIDTKAQMATFQDTFVPLGFARQEAAKLSEKMVALAVDLASFNNQNDTEASDKLVSALVGNHETVRSYGVIITEASLKQKLMAMGMADSTEKATEQQKVMARLQMIIDGTSDAQGDAIRTAAGFANSFKGLKGEMKDLAADIGQMFLPAASSVVASMRGWVADLKKHREEFVAWGKSIGRSAAEAVTSLVGFVATHKDMIMSIVTSIPQILAAAVAIKGLSVAFTVAGAALGQSAMATLLSPTGVIIMGLAALAACYVDAQAKGQSWADSIAEQTAKLLGFENAVTAANAAIAAGNKTKDNVGTARDAMKSVNDQKAKGTLTADSLKAEIAELEKAKKAQMAHAKSVIGKTVSATDQASITGRAARSTTFDKNKGSWWSQAKGNLGWYKVPGLEQKRDRLAEQRDLSVKGAQSIQLKIDALTAELAGLTAVETERKLSAGLQPEKAAPTGPVAAIGDAYNQIRWNAGFAMEGVQGMASRWGASMKTEWDDERKRESEKADKRDKGGDIVDASSMLADLQKKSMNSDKKIAEKTAKAAEETAKAQPTQTALLTNIRDYVANGFKVKFGV